MPPLPLAQFHPCSRQTSSSACPSYSMAQQDSALRIGQICEEPSQERGLQQLIPGSRIIASQSFIDTFVAGIHSCRVLLSSSTKSQPIENNSYDNKSLFPETNGCTNSSGLNKLKKLSSFERSRVLPNLLLEPIPCVTSAAPPRQRRKRRRWQALKILKPGWPPPPLLSIFSLGTWTQTGILELSMNQPVFWRPHL